MIKILEKDGNITTTDHTDILNILTVQSEFMFAGFFFLKNILSHKFSTILDSAAADSACNSTAFSDQHAGSGTSWSRS